MKAGVLSDYFNGIGAKRLTTVEIDPSSSNQHEFQGVHKLKEILGVHEDKLTLDAKYLRLSDENEIESVESFATWSNVRRNNPNRSAEYHMYYSSIAAPLVHSCKPDDLLIVAIRPDKSLVIFLVDCESTYEEQLLWLFGLTTDLEQINIRDIANEYNRELYFSARFILDDLGIDIEIADDNWLDLLLNRFGENFPSTSAFSSYARETIKDEVSFEEPDNALMLWIEHEEMLFRTLERHFVSKQLEKGFTDVDDFIKYSLGVQNRRKSRAGFALENHLEFIFKGIQLNYDRGKITENKAKPDFIFPGIDRYHDSMFSSSNLTMLGVKSTCKDRWRQVLSEAARIKKKHLFTLEPSISKNQTSEMDSNNLQLVIPESIHDTYSDSQQNWIMSLNEFIDLVRSRQG
jgi:hypothetical protein